VRKFFWYLAVSTLLLGTISTPLRLNADGNPMPACPTGKTSCKPVAAALVAQAG